MIAAGTEKRALPFTYNNITGAFLWLQCTINLTLTVCLILDLRLRPQYTSATKADQALIHCIGRLAQVCLRTAAPTALFALLGALMATARPPNQISSINALFAFTRTCSDLLLIDAVRHPIHVALVFAVPLPALYTHSLIYTLASRREFVSDAEQLRTSLANEGGPAWTPDQLDPLSSVKSDPDRSRCANLGEVAVRHTTVVEVEEQMQDITPESISPRARRPSLPPHLSSSWRDRDEDTKGW